MCSLGTSTPALAKGLGQRAIRGLFLLASDKRENETDPTAIDSLERISADGRREVVLHGICDIARRRCHVAGSSSVWRTTLTV